MRRTAGESAGWPLPFVFSGKFPVGAKGAHGIFSMINPTVETTSTPTPEALVDGSLSSYRAAREGRQAPACAAGPKEESVADGSGELGETAAVDGPAESSTEQGDKPAPGGEEVDAEPKKKGSWQRTIERQKR